MRFEKSDLKFFKVDGKVAYGWAIVSTIKGEPYYDLHGDYIPDEAMVEAAQDFMKNFRVGKAQHEGAQVGEIVFAFPVTKTNKPTVNIDSDRTGLLIGFEIHDAELLAKVKDGTMTGFSIGGFLEEAEVISPAALLTPKRYRGELLKRALAKAGNGAKRNFVTFKIREISIVDRPAQEPALISYVKRFLSKGAVFTSIVDGHQHAVDPDCTEEWIAGHTDHATSSGAEYGHSHPWIWREDGTIQLGMNEGHTHEVDFKRGGLPSEIQIIDTASSTSSTDNLTANKALASVGLNSKETMTMDPKDTEILNLKAMLAKSEKLVALSDAEKAHFHALPDYARDSWLNKSAAEKSADVEVVYTTVDGTKLRKSDGAMAIEFAKRADKATSDAKVIQDAAVSADIAKRAPVILKSYPGVENHKALVLKAIEGIPDPDAKTAALAMIEAGEKALSKGFTASGTGDQTGNPNPDPTSQTPQAQFDVLVAKRMKDVPTDNLGSATLHVMRNEGAALYKALASTK